MTERGHHQTERRGRGNPDLKVRVHHIQPSLHIGAKGLTDAIIAQVRQALSKRDLIKIKIRVDATGEADAIGRELARRVPCRLVQRIGKVVVVCADRSEPD